MQADKFIQLPTEKILWFFRKKNEQTKTAAIQNCTPKATL